MTKILIAGATGLVGGHVLTLALADDRIESVIAPTRRPLATHAKLYNPVSNLSSLSADSDWWAVDGVVCTLGTTRANAGSAEAFRAIDLDMQLAVAQHARAHGAQRFALTSSMGADSESRHLYLRTKGELEVALKQLAWPSLTIVRPGAILGERAETRNSEIIFGALLRIIGPILPRRFRGNSAQSIARVLLEAAIVGIPGTHIVNADKI